MPWLYRLSVTVGIVVSGSSVRVPSVKSRGPMQRTPSTSVKPVEVEATPIGCWMMVSPSPRLMVSVYSVPTDNRRCFQLMISLYIIPEKGTEPLETAKALPVSTLVLVFT